MLVPSLSSVILGEVESSTGPGSSRGLLRYDDRYGDGGDLGGLSLDSPVEGHLRYLHLKCGPSDRPVNQTEVPEEL